jgi:hypothetical protein
MGNAYRIFEARDHFGYLGVTGRIMLGRISMVPSSSTPVLKFKQNKHFLMR